MKILYRLQRILVTVSSTIYVRLLMRIKGVNYGKGFYCCGRIFIDNKSESGGIKIGDHVNINSSGTRNPGVVEGRTMLITTSTGHIKIGNKVGISNCILYSECGITIGNEVTIGAGTKIIDTDGCIPFYVRKKKYQRSSPIIIGNRVFIGGNVILLKGVTIGDEAVIGSGAVITHDIGEKEIWAGNPARCIKELH